MEFGGALDSASQERGCRDGEIEDELQKGDRTEHLGPAGHGAGSANECMCDVSDALVEIVDDLGGGTAGNELKLIEFGELIVRDDGGCACG